MGYKLLLFDADGTLFDFEKAERRAFRNTLEKYKIEGDFSANHKIYEVYNKGVWKDFEDGKITSKELRIKLFRQFLDHLNKAEDSQEMSRYYIKELAKGTDLIDGAEELIKKVAESDNDYEYVIITNGIADVQHPRIMRSKLAGYFKGKIFVSEEVGYPKPDRRYFEGVLKDYSEFQLDEILIIGDSLNSDIKGGVELNIATCWMNPQRHKGTDRLKADYEISQLSELYPLLGL